MSEKKRTVVLGTVFLVSLALAYVEKQAEISKSKLELNMKKMNVQKPNVNQGRCV